MSLKEDLTNAEQIGSESFNPCCNGMSLKVRCTAVSPRISCFNPCCNGMSLKVPGFKFDGKGNVLILVVMECL